MAGIATASIRPATQRATPISISVMPRADRMFLLAGSGRALPAVNRDVVAAALRLVLAIGIDVVAFTGADVAVLRTPRVLVYFLDVLGDQLLERVRPLPGLDVVEVHAVGNGLQVEQRGALLR